MSSNDKGNERFDADVELTPDAIATATRGGSSAGASRTAVATAGGAATTPARTNDPAPTSAPSPLDRVSRDSALPLSFMQEQLWLLARLDPSTPTYNLPWLIDTPTPLDALALERSLEELIRRHEALRTTFTMQDGHPAQLVHAPPELKLPVLSVEELPPGEQDAELHRVARAEARRPFDLESGPLFRALLIKLSGGRCKLLFVVHHIVFDAYSGYNTLFPELITLYESFSSGGPSPLPEVPLQNADYAAWQRRHVKGPDLERHLAYWKQKLADLPVAVKLPTDRPWPASPSARGDFHSILVPQGLVGALRSTARRGETTLFTVMLAGLYALLYRHTEQENLVVGTVIGDRGSSERRAILGNLINTIVLRATVDPERTFLELVRDVRGVLGEAREHSELPFELLVNELRPQRVPGRNPLFQIAFNRVPSARSGEWSITHHGVTTGTTSFDLLFDLHDVPEGMLVHIQYSTDLFDTATVARLADHYANVLTCVADDPDRPIYALPILTQEEQRQLAAWNETRENFPEAALLHEEFEAHARRSASAIAVITRGAQVTYGQLNDRAERLAHDLQSLGVKPDSLVGLCVTRSVDMIVGLLAILKAGGAYVPLDPSYPRERLAYILDDARVDVLVTQTHLVSALPAHRARVVLLDGNEDGSERRTQSRGGERPPPSATSENLAYVIYTSGSTGRPKGAALEHRGLRNLFTSQRRWFNVGPGSRVLQFASFSFDVSIWEISIALTSGAALVIGSNEELRPGPALIETLRRHEVTIALLSPSVLAVLPEGSERELPALEVVATGVEPCSPAILARWASGRRFINAYGPTEATVYATACECASGDAAVPIGRPIANMSTFVLDPRMQIVPVGVPGELYISGPGLARCYINRPDITAERFVPNPYSEAPGQRMYRTGDIVRYLVDGRLEFLGRADHQVKIRGFRVELGEIEAVLKQHTSVQNAIAVTSGDTSLERRVVVFVVLLPARGNLGEAELRQWLQQKVPEHLVPTSIIVVARLPLTPSGKIDRLALSAAAGRREAAPSGVLRGDTERMIASIWEKVLGVERVGPHDNFFNLGGNSLLIAQVHDALTAGFHDDLPMTTLFQYPTVRSLAEHFHRASAGDAADAFDQVRDRAKKQREAMRRQGLRMQAKKRSTNE